MESQNLLSSIRLSTFWGLLHTCEIRGAGDVSRRPQAPHAGWQPVPLSMWLRFWGLYRILPEVGGFRVLGVRRAQVWFQIGGRVATRDTEP